MEVSLRFSLSKRFLLILSIVFLLLFSLFPLFMKTSMAGHDWGIEFVDRTGNYVGKYSSIKIDSQGRPHISYIGEYPGGWGLKYAHWNGTTWEIEVVDSSIPPSAGTSLALDSSDYPHISYYDGDNEDLRYAHWNGTGWEIEVVDSLGNVGYHSSLDVDSQGRPHITYGLLQNDTGRIRYAYWDGTLWIFHDLGYSNRAGGSHLVLDSLDTPHMSFYDITEGNVLYAKWDGLDWLVEVVDGEGGSGEYNSLALDSYDRPHIAYHTTYLPGDNELRYAFWNGTDWIIETAWVGGSTSFAWLSLDVDSQGNPGIAYVKPSVRDLLYIWRSEGKWYNETVDPGPEDVRDFSLTFDQMDFPHISYCYDGETDLFHAAVVPPPLPDLTLSEWDIGFEPSSPVLNGTSVNISATIRNIGGADASGVKARFYDGRPPFGVQISGDQNLGTIPSLSSSTASIQWTAGPPGPHEICVYADPDNTISEFDETNNMACKPIEVIVPPLPDLTLSPLDITFDRPPPFPNGTSIEINATIHNVGYANATNVSVRFTDNPYGQIDIDKNISFIPMGGEGQAEAMWNATPVGSHEICVIADPENEIVELNETNNQACIPVEVADASVPSPPRDLNAILTGKDFENVSLSWSLSLDDGAGRNNVARYDIYRGNLYDSSGSSYLLYASLPAGKSSYVDIQAGEGDPRNYFYYVCAVNSFDLSSCTVNQAGKFTRPLFKGPNLISIPLIQSNESIETVLQTVKWDKAWSYDSFSREWSWYMSFKTYKGSLTSMNETKGYWVNVTRDCNFTVAGIVSHNTSIQLKKGWNLVSFPSFEDNYTVADLKLEVNAISVEGFSSSSEPYYLMLLQESGKLMAGFGYWVKIPEDASWLVSS